MAAAAPRPAGWSAEPAGLRRRRAVEVVFDPRRHDAVFLRGDAPAAARLVTAAECERQGAGAGSELLVRDRVAAARRDLAARAAAAAGHPALPGLGVAA